MRRDKRDHADPTSDNAVGSVDKEWRYMVHLALKIRSGLCNPVWAAEQEAKFTGIYRRLLTDSVFDLEKEARRR